MGAISLRAFERVAETELPGFAQEALLLVHLEQLNTPSGIFSERANRNTKL